MIVFGLFSSAITTSLTVVVVTGGPQGDANKHANVRITIMVIITKNKRGAEVLKRDTRQSHSLISIKYCWT